MSHIDQLRHAVAACEDAAQRYGWRSPLTCGLYEMAQALERQARDRRRKGTFDHPDLPELSARAQALRESRYGKE